jgi:hypothetical protein
MTLPEALDAGREAERTLALPGLVLGTPLHTDEPVLGPAGAASGEPSPSDVPAAPLASEPSFAPTTPLDRDGITPSADQRTPTQSWPAQPAAGHYPSQTASGYGPPPQQPTRGRSPGCSWAGTTPRSR